MTVKLHTAGQAHLRSLIDAGKYTTAEGWDFTGTDGDALLGKDGNDWTRYSSVHLGEDDAEDTKTKAHWHYPAAKAKSDSEEVHRAALVAAKQRAAQQGDNAIEDAAGELIELIDKKEGAGKKENRTVVLTPKAARVALTDMPRLAARVFGTPLLISRQKLDVIMGVLGPRLGIDVPAPVRQMDDDEGGSITIEAPEPYTLTDDGLATISIDGTLVYKCSWLGAISGLTGYNDVRAALGQALADPSVKGILLEVCSYGGEASGMPDTADMIRAVGQHKPVFGVAADYAYSAAYGLLSGAQKIYASRTSGIGSIGTVALHLDQSGADAARGLKYTYLTAGAHKADANPHEPLSDPARAELQAEIDHLNDIFVAMVAGNRGMSADDVANMQARTFTGQQAIDARLADALGTPEDAMAGLRAEVAARAAKAAAQAAAPQAPQEPAQPVPPPGTPENPGGPDAKKPETNVVSLAAAREQGASAAAETHLEIAELCNLAGHPQLAAAFIGKKLSIAQVRKELMAVRAHASAARPTTGAILPDAGLNQNQTVAAGWDKALQLVCGVKSKS